MNTDAAKRDSFHVLHFLAGILLYLLTTYLKDE